ncbi:MAG: GXGXG motif-containing protein [Actinomycetota bacterium]|nr:GXGXG motif-containing protein [Actinomycetota bacterium]MEC8873340.1 GXGXG motif-containing protein [Actinomycetota bacterium]MEC8970272.1 GXGXG motif-containing protein [Actinomycetota bacterium]
MAGLNTKSGVVYDARGLVEPDPEPPLTAEIDGDSAVIDATDLTTRKINLELKRVVYDEGVNNVTIVNPGSKHSLGVGILKRCNITFEGSPGWYACGLIDGPEVQINGRVGWALAENMMSGSVVVEGPAGSLTGAALRGGDLVIKGNVGARTGIDQKGGTIIALGSAGINTGFMMQRGRQIICGDVNDGLGDSMYDGVIYVGGKIASLGVDCVPGEMNDDDREFINRKFEIYDLGPPPELQKFECGKVLHNYDALEPSERKLVL